MQKLKKSIERLNNLNIFHYKINFDLSIYDKEEIDLISEYIELLPLGKLQSMLLRSPTIKTLFLKNSYFNRLCDHLVDSALLFLFLNANDQKDYSLDRAIKIMITIYKNSELLNKFALFNIDQVKEQLAYQPESRLDLLKNFNSFVDNLELIIFQEGDAKNAQISN